MNRLLSFLLILLANTGFSQGIQQVDVRRLVPPQDVLYQATTVRNIQQYPLTVAGLNSFTAAASRGEFNLTVTCPNGTQALIPSGVRPPLLPPCTATLTSATSTIGLAAQYTYSLSNGGAIQVRGQGTGAYTMKIRRVDGGSMSLSNAANPSLQANTAYPFGTVSGDYPLDWTFYGVPQVPIELVFILNGTSYSRSFTPAVTATPQQLFVAGNSSPPSSGTVTTPSATTGGTFAGGYGEGTYSQLVAFAPFVPAYNQLSSWPQGNTTQYITSTSGKKAGFLKSVGGSLSHLSWSGGPNLVNTFTNGFPSTFEGSPSPDVGRSAGAAFYGSPNGANQYPFSAFSPLLNQIESTSKGPGSDDTGWNGVIGGSAFQNHSEIIWYERRTVNGKEVVYIQTRPLQWSLHGVPAEIKVHMWYYWNSDSELKYFYLIDNFRSDTQMKFIGRLQELPFAYLKADLYRYFIYSGNSPGTNGSLQQINKGQPCEGSDGNCNQNDTGDFITSESWIGAVNNSDQGVFNVTGYNALFGGKQFQSWSGDEFSNASAYFNSRVQTANFDLTGCTAWSGSFYVGGLSDFRSWLGANPVDKLPFSFSFGLHKTAGWYGEDAAARFNSDDRYQYAIGQKNQDGSAGGSFCSPWGGWKASDIQTIYIKGRFSGISSLVMQWKRPGEDEITVEQFNNKSISVVGDGQERTYAITMSGTANWDGIIGRIKLKLPRPYPNTSGSEYFIPTYIGTVNPN